MPTEVVETVENVERTWIDSFDDYAKDHLKIQTMEGELKPFSMNPIQRVFCEVIEDIKKNDRLVRIVVLKARREGMSTLTAGRFFHKTATMPNRYAMMIAHEPDATDFLFGMHRRFLSNLDDDWRPQTKYNSRKILEFNRPDGKKGGLDSAIRCATAGKEDVGSAQLIHYLHLSELAKWPTHTTEALLTSVLQCVPDTEDTEIIEESTAKGLGNQFHTRYLQARFKYQVYLDAEGQIAWRCEIDEKAPKGNSYSAIFFPWFVFPSYKMPVQRWERMTQEKFKRTEEEQKIADTHFQGVGTNEVDQRLCWRRWCLVNKCRNSVKNFQQEYPATDVEAFVSSGRAVFDAYKILDLMNNAPEPKVKYEIVPTGHFLAESHGRFWVWEEPVPARHYMVSADIAEGIEVASDAMAEDGEGKYDYTVMDVWDLDSGKQVAQWHGHIDADLAGHLLCHIGKRYNMAWLVPERNKDGLTTVTTIMNNGYPWIYVEKIPDPPGKPRKRYGWLTTKATKPAAVNQLIAEVRDDTHGIVSPRTFKEMLSFKTNEKGEYEAEEGQHDDCVISASIAKITRIELLSWGPSKPTSPYSDGSTWNAQVQKGGEPPIGAWT